MSQRTRHAHFFRGLTAIGLAIVACTQSASPTSSPTASSGASALGAAAGQPQYGGVLVGLVNDDPPHFDPIESTGANVFPLIGPVYSGLLRFDPSSENKIIGDLAESWDVSTDGVLYTFHLRHGVKFHDGVVLTSQDVKFSLDRIRTPPTGVVSGWKALLASVGDVQTPDADTVQVKLKAPTAAFLAFLASGAINVVPKHVVDAKGSMKADLIGTGAFKLKQYIPGVMLELEKNNDYFIKGLPYLDGIRFLINKDPVARVANFLAGNADVTITVGDGRITKSDADSIAAKMGSRARILTTTSAGTEALWMNTKRKPWDNVQVRQAVNLAIDRQFYAQAVYQGDFQPGAFLTAPFGLPQQELMQVPGFRQPKDADRAEAKRLLASAGYPNGFDARLSCEQDAKDLRRCQFLKDQMAMIGINLTLNVQETGAFSYAIQTQDYELLNGSGGSSLDPDPNLPLYINVYTGSSRNRSFFGSPQVDSLIDKQAVERDPDKRLAIIRNELLPLLFQLVPRAEYGSETNYIAVKTTVRNWMPRTNQFSFHQHQQTWLAK